jgi:hypothetical protein
LPLDTENYYAPLGPAVSPRPNQQDNNIDSGKASFSSASPTSVDVPLPTKGQHWQNRTGKHPAPNKGGFRPPSTPLKPEGSDAFGARCLEFVS